MTKPRSSPSAASLSGSVRPASAQDTAAISHSMTSAFYDDPSFVWCMPDSAARKEQLPAFFRIVFDALVGFGKCYCTSDSAAASMWVPPGHEPLTEEQSASLHGVFETVGAVEAARFTALIELMDSLTILTKITSTSGCWASRHTARIVDLGSTLLRSGLDLCDERSAPRVSGSNHRAEPTVVRTPRISRHRRVDCQRVTTHVGDVA